MQSKAEVIKAELAGKRVLDIGGCGFGADNAYERQLREAWGVVASRTTVDSSDHADISVDINREWPPLPANQWDITTAFDILEHLENPIAVLRAIPTDLLLVSLPNVLSPFCRRLEKIDLLHLYSFTDYTARTLLTTAGWQIEQLYYTFGKWSWASRLINTVGSLFPAWVGTGIMIHCRRK
ncbi:MAG: hypothetical protein PHO14_01955 [Kiritimatiellae bacterium]|jgi:hypothetical protein|nr:hypothetical protein [Kiritimatiellia bacterium]MDD4340980.1 hypothetical protein [Kiritimatiellia bacterium]MDY0149612.1 hypothetical protein [Kiritimatiellia bacterium]